MFHFCLNYLNIVSKLNIVKFVINIHVCLVMDFFCKSIKRVSQNMSPYCPTLNIEGLGNMMRLQSDFNLRYLIYVFLKEKYIFIIYRYDCVVGWPYQWVAHTILVIALVLAVTLFVNFTSRFLKSTQSEYNHDI